MRRVSPGHIPGRNKYRPFGLSRNTGLNKKGLRWPPTLSISTRKGRPALGAVTPIQKGEGEEVTSGPPNGWSALRPLMWPFLIDVRLMSNAIC